MRRAWFLSPLVLLASLWAAPGVAQQGSLDDVEALAAAGRAADARTALEEWWQTGLSQASRQDRQRGIYLRGVLTVDPPLAEMDFQRLVLEFPGGPYSAAALGRLGYAAQARGDLAVAADHFDSVLRDYPGSPQAEEAERWLQRWDSQLLEARAQARAARGAPALAEAEPTPAATEPEVTQGGAVTASVEGPDRSGEYAVQLGAFRSSDRARIVEERARAAGLEPRIVRVEGSDLIRIRVGWFETSRQASEVMVDIRGLGLEAAVVKDAQRERPAG